MNDTKKEIDRLKKLLDKILLINETLLMIHNLPILRKVNAEIKKKWKGLTNERTENKPRCDQRNER